MLKTTPRPRTEDKSVDANLAEWSPASQKNTMLALAECLQQLAPTLSREIDTVLQQFGESDINGAFDRAAQLIDQLRFDAATSCKSDRAVEIIKVIDKVRENAWTAVEFATNLIRNDLRGASPELTKAAFEQLMSDVVSGIQELRSISESLDAEIKPAPSIDEIIKQLESISKSKLVHGDPNTSVSKPPDVRESRSAFGPSSENIVVAEVGRVSSRCKPERILLVNTAEFVGKDGQIYQLTRSSNSSISPLDPSKESDLVLSYNVHKGSSFIGSIANYKIAGIGGTENGAASLKSDLLAGAQISGLDLNSNKIEVSYDYDPKSGLDLNNLTSEILSISGVRTAFSRLSAKAIETFSKSTSPKRIHSLCAAFFANDYVYSKDPELSRLIEQIPQNLRFSFLAGLRIGKCTSMSYELQNFLAIAGVPAIVEGGPVYDPKLKAFCNPGHARVRCIGEPSVVIDPTLWVSKSYNVITPDRELKEQVLAQLADADENKAFEIGEQLRGKLLATNINSGGQGAADQNSGGHQLKDDFNRQSARDLGLELVDPLEAIKLWSELIALDLDDGRFFYLQVAWKWDDALVKLLKRDQEAILSGNPAVFTDWLIACLQHPDPKLSVIVNRAFFNSYVFRGSSGEEGPIEKAKSCAIPVLKVLATVNTPNYFFDDFESHRRFGRFLEYAYIDLNGLSHRSDIKDIYTQAAIRSLHAWENRSGWEHNGGSRAALMRLLIDRATDTLSGDWAKIIHGAVAEILKVDNDNIALRFASGIEGELDDRCIEGLTTEVQSFSQMHCPFIKSQSIKSLDLHVNFARKLRESIEKISRDILDVNVINVVLGGLSLTSAKSLLRNILIHGDEDSRQISREEVDILLQCDSFQDGIRNNAATLLGHYLEDILALESNLPDLNRQELRDLAREAIALVSSIGALKLDYPSQLVKLREWLERQSDVSSPWHEIAWLYLIIDTLIEHGILLESDVAELCQQVDESEVAWEIWGKLNFQKTNIFHGSRNIIQIFRSDSAENPKLERLWDLMLLSIQAQAASLPPGWADFADAVVELYVPDSIKTVWRVVSDQDPELLSSLTGVKTEQDLTYPLWKAAVMMADGAINKIIEHSFLMTADDGSYDPEAPNTRRVLCDALRIYIPDLKEPSHVEAYASVITQVLMGDLKPLQPDYKLKVSWRKLQEKSKVLPGSIRRHLWNRFKEVHIEHSTALNKGHSQISPDLWRSALQGSSTKPTGKVMRALSGVSDPYDVRNLTQYAPGDSIRMIDWKASGRSDQIYVKQPERVLPGNPDQVTVCIDRSDMGTTGEYIAINHEFIDKLICFVRSMIADKKSPSIAFFSYGVPDSIMSAAEVRELFYDADGSRASALLISNASHSADALISAMVTRNCPTIAPVAEAEVLKMANTSVLLMLTNKSGTRTAPKTRIWVDRFSSQLQSSGKAARIDI